jgi:hypothetical protein
MKITLVEILAGCWMLFVAAFMLTIMVGLGLLIYMVVNSPNFQQMLGY